MSGKRKAEERLEGEKSKATHVDEHTGPHAPKPVDEDNPEELVFEDPFEDEFEDESFDLDEEGEYDDDAAMADADEDEEGDGDAAMEQDEDDEEGEGEARKVWLPGVSGALGEGETLEYDSEAYDVIHFFGVEWPALSFDLLPDALGHQRTKYPHTLFLVAGTQAETAAANKLVVLKLSQLSKTRETDEDEDDDAVELGESSGEDDDPLVEHRDVAHSHGGVNRVRAMPQQPHLVAALADNAHAAIYDVRQALQTLGHESARGARAPHAVHVFKGHAQEGWALAWSPKEAGRLLTGDGAGRMHVWQPQEGKWAVDARAFEGHVGSVEDVQWSPSEADVFASCGVDGHVRLWDARRGRAPVASVAAHVGTDANVLSWNGKRAFLLVSGGDDGAFRVWDLRKLGAETAAQFDLRWHKQAITSIEWNPNDDSVLAATSEDDSCSIWDLSLANEKTQVDGVDIPAQLMFLHQGQHGMKEVHWHRQIPSMLLTTAEDGLCVFKPNNLQ